MTQQQPSIDEILESIRERVTGEAPALPESARPVIEVAQLVSAALPDLGNIAAAPAGMTVDGLIRSMLQPMLKQWLDANLPEIVEKVAQAEIRRLTGHD